MSKGKKVFTTGDVAKICNVAPRTVSKWFDSGQLKGYRIPGSKDRRIPVSELERFMKAHNMPLSALGSGKSRILIADTDKEAAFSLAQKLNEKAGYEVQVSASNFETGAMAEKFSPHVLILNLLAKNINAQEICEYLHNNSELETIKIIAVSNQLSDLEAQALLQKGFDDYVFDLNDIDSLITKIEHATAIVY